MDEGQHRSLVAPDTPRSSRRGDLRPLIVRFGALGDMVILLSLVHALYERFGESVDIVSSGAWNRPLFAGQPGVGELHLIRSRKTPYWLTVDQRRLVSDLRARGATPVWNCDGDDRTRALLRRAGIPPSHVVDAGLIGRHPEEHEVDRWLRLAGFSPEAFASRCPAARDVGSCSVPPLLIADRQRVDADRWLAAKSLLGKPLVLIQAGNSRTMRWWRPRDRDSNTKYWPERCWGAVIDAVAGTEQDAQILLCGAPNEVSLNQSILSHVQTKRAHNVAEDLPLPRLLALQERAIGMISVDTGPAHSAAALDCPLVVLFGTADPAMYMPRSSAGCVKPVRRLEQGRPSMRSIAVEDVIAAWQGLHLRRTPQGCR